MDEAIHMHTCHIFKKNYEILGILYGAWPILIVIQDLWQMCLHYTVQKEVLPEIFKQLVEEWISECRADSEIQCKARVEPMMNTADSREKWRILLEIIKFSRIEFSWNWYLKDSEYLTRMAFTRFMDIFYEMISGYESKQDETIMKL